MKTKVEIYRSGKNFYWRMRRKGRIVADGSEGYKREASLRKTLSGIISGGFTLVANLCEE